MYYSAPYAIAFGRVLLSIMFISAGIEKVLDYAGTQFYMAARGVPRDLLPLAIAVELGAGLGVLFGLFTRWSAFLLAGFCVVTALAFHTDFSDRMQMISFMKNITIAGGFIVLMGSGPGAFALDNRRR